MSSRLLLLLLFLLLFLVDSTSGKCSTLFDLPLGFVFVFVFFFWLHSITAMIAMKPDCIIKQSVAFIDLLWLVLSWITANNEVIESGPCLRSAHDSCCCCCCCCCWSTVVVVAPWINKIVSGCSPLLHQSTICKAPVTISPTLAVTVVAQLCPKYHQLIAKLLLKKNWKVRGGGGEWTGAFGSTVKRLLLRCNCSAVTNDAHWIDLFSRLNFELRFPNDSESIGSLAPISRLSTAIQSKLMDEFNSKVMRLQTKSCRIY